MTLNTDKTTKKDASDQDTNQDQANAGTNQDNNQGENQDKDSGKVPLNTFLDQKKINKELKDKLATYEAKDKAAADAKLLEEKKYEELIQTKSSETEALRKELDLERKNSKLKTIENKFTSELSKINVVDADDALKLIKYDDLLESDSFDDEIKVRVSELAKNKTYLFKATGSNRSNTENGRPTGNTPPKQQGKNSKVDPVILSLSQKLNKI